ncbi:MAG: AAA family ATPase [Bacteroidales bacterium]|nr:AAA family ATPase [Bacteroidales bacterium]
MTQKEAVLKVLRDANKPMKCAEISNVAVRDGLLTKRTKAVNFESSVRSYIVELLSEGLVKQVDKGLYEINNNVGLNETETNNIYELNMTTKSTDNTIKYYGRNIILYGAPGTGKSYTAKQIVENKAKGDNTCKELKLDNMSGGECVRVTFHPDTDYASFVGCYKPSMNGKEIEYKFVPQAFLRIYVDAWKNLISGEKIQQYYLIIEELNRGNCAQIFGDIFQLLDRNDNGYSDYYILADTDVVDYLKSDDGFGNDEYNEYTKKLKKEYPEGATDIDKGVLALPCNLTILATMNTSDQSLFPIDSAFKRRWEWKYVRINYDAVDLKDVKLWNGTTKWLDFIEAINTYIADKTHSADKQIGERFVKPKDSKIDYETFRDKVMFYLFNDVFKDDVEFGKMVSGETSYNKVFLFENLFEDKDEGQSKIKSFITERCPVKKTESD